MLNLDTLTPEQADRLVVLAAFKICRETAWEEWAVRFIQTGEVGPIPKLAEPRAAAFLAMYQFTLDPVTQRIQRRAIQDAVLQAVDRHWPKFTKEIARMAGHMGIGTQSDEEKMVETIWKRSKGEE